MSDNAWVNENAHFSIYAFKESAESKEVKVMVEIVCQAEPGTLPLTLQFPLSEQRWRAAKAAADRGIYELRGAKPDGQSH